MRKFLYFSMAMLLGIVLIGSISQPIRTDADGTPTPQPSVQTPIITTHNASKIKELLQLGYGQPANMAWSRDNKWFSIASSLGIRLYDASTLKETQFFGNSSDKISSVNTNDQPVFDLSKDMLAYVYPDNSIQIWKIETGQPYRKITPKTTQIFQVAFSPDGTLLAFQTDKDIQLWDLLTNQQKTTLDNSTDTLTDLTFRSDTALIAAKSSKNGIKIWDTETGRIRSTIIASDGNIKQILFSPDGKLLVTEHTNMTVHVWEVSTGSSISTWQSPEHDQNLSIFFKPNQILVAFDKTYNNNTQFGIQLQDVMTGKEIATFCCHDAPIIKKIISPDGSLIASGSEDSNVVVWRVDTSKQQIKFTTKITETNGIIFSPDNKYLATIDQDADINVWNTLSGSNEIHIQDYSNSIMGLALHPAPDQTIISSNFDGSAKVWSISPPAVKHILVNPNIIQKIAFSNDGSLLASIVIHGGIQLWRTDTWQIIKELPSDVTVPAYDRSYSLAFNLDSTMLASAGPGSTVQLWNLQNDSISTLNGHSYPVVAVTISPNGLLLASVDDHGSIRLWNTKTHLEQLTMQAENNPLDIRFSPDSHLLATAHSSGTIQIWDVDSGKQYSILNTQSGAINSLAFNTDGTVLAGADHDGNIQLWDVGSSQRLIALQGHESYITSVAFSSDGTMLVSGDYDGVIKIWGVHQ